MRTFALLTALALPLAACDGGDDPSAELAEANAKVSQAMAVGLSGGAGGAFAEAARFRPVYDCPGGGSVDVTTSGSSGGGVSYTMAFSDCYDVSGSFGVVSSFSFGSGGVSTSSRLDGDLSVQNSCDITYDGFRTSTQTDTGAQQTTLTYDGSITASCPSGTATCRFDGASFTVGADGSGAPTSFDGYCD